MRDKILIVDDSKFNREILRDILKNAYPIMEAENGQEALEIIEKQPTEIAAVLLDIVMPVMDGVTLLKLLNEKKYLNEFPVLVVTSEQSINLVAECFDYGISDFIRKPVNTEFVKQRVEKLVNLYALKNQYKEVVEKQTVAIRKQYALLQKQAQQLKLYSEKITEALGTVVEYRNVNEQLHITRVKEFTRILANHMMKLYPEYELTEEKIQDIVSARALHDIGKIRIRDTVLMKPGKLTEEEFEYVKSHSLRGFEMINSIAGLWSEPYLQYCREITRSHHEKYDGAGYPDGLKGDEIPISAQIVSLADCYERLISESMYASARTLDEAYTMIQQGECGAFSYKLLECFRAARPELESYIKTFEKTTAE